MWRLADGTRTIATIASALASRYGASPRQTAAGARRLLRDLAGHGLLEGSTSGGASRRLYDLLDVRFGVVADDPEVLSLLDRLQSQLRARVPREPDVIYQVERTDGIFRVRSHGVVVREASSALEAAAALEWLMADEAADRDTARLHVHGAVVAGRRVSILLPAGHRAGKTTLALALRMRGLRLYSDDVAFIDPRTWRPAAVPRSVHVEDDGLARLRGIGFADPRGRRIGTYLEAGLLAPWPRTPGPPLGHVVLPRMMRGERSQLVPVPAAQAAVELIGCSRNVQRTARFGTVVVRELFARVRCWSLHMGGDLEEAAALAAGLATSA